MVVETIIAKAGNMQVFGEGLFVQLLIGLLGNTLLKVITVGMIWDYSMERQYKNS